MIKRAQHCISSFMERHCLIRGGRGMKVSPAMRVAITQSTYFFYLNEKKRDKVFVKSSVWPTIRLYKQFQQNTKYPFDPKFQIPSSREEDRSFFRFLFFFCCGLRVSSLDFRLKLSIKQLHYTHIDNNFHAVHFSFLSGSYLCSLVCFCLYMQLVEYNQFFHYY